MSKNSNPQENSVTAVRDLIHAQDIPDYCKELSLMHSAFIRSDFADDQRQRILVDSTYNNLRDFLLTLQSLHIKAKDL